VRRFRRAAAVTTALIMTLAALHAASAQAIRLQLQPIAGGLAEPVFVTGTGDGSGRLFIVEQAGIIRAYVNGAIRSRPFLDIRDRVLAGGELGLLSVAFHPRYKENGRFFLNYTTDSGGRLRTVIAEYKTVPPTSNVANRGERVLLTIPQPFRNHNGGLNMFGPDGMLYIGLGDGGSGGDPQNNGQRLDTLLGKILRINVDGALPYAVPPDNPFVTRKKARPEIWAYGLRNPWRFSFDPAANRAFVGDVGQNAWEEIDIMERGRNYGWRIMEGAHCYSPPSGCPTAGLKLPVAEYSHTDGCAVTGGYVYRGTRIPSLVGKYVYGDYCSGRIWTLSGGGPWTASLLLATSLRISSFGTDDAGELYVVDHDGNLFKLIPAP
jgi:glucose/arabinose dehydrogenase